MSANLIVLLGRILLCIIFLQSGWEKLADPGTAENAFSTAGMLAGKGMPAPVALAYISGAFELIASILVIIGFQTRIASVLLALFCVVAGLMFHLGTTGDPTMDAINPIMFAKNLAIAGGFLILATYGPGGISLDARRR